MAYTPIYEKPYENGWEDLPSENTPATADILDQYDDTFEHIEEYLEENPIIQTSTMPTASEDELGHIYQYMGETTLAFTQGYFYKCVSDEEEEPSYSWENIDVQSGGGGGTTVVANPVGEPTDDLETIQIGNTIYDIPGGGGGNANIWTGTQAEYEAQASQIADDTVVLITDDEQEVVEGGTIYSEEEQCIGLWIDKRPLYQKTYVFGADVTVSHETFTNLTTFTIPTGIDYVRNAECFRIGNKGLLSIDCALVASGGSTYIAIRNSSAYDISVASGSTLTITYTKSTDAPLDAVVGKKTMYIASSDCYSTVEKEVGCWTDGKPLYQKSITFNNAITATSNTWIDTGVDIANAVVTNAEAVLYQSDGNSVVVECNIGADGSVYILNPRSTNMDINTLTLQYTKTTDTPGSGQYTPASGKAVHYSTDEQVIGTWTNGKPLYQITKTLTSGIAINTYGTIDLPSGIIVRDIKGYIYRNSYQSVDMFNGYIENGQIFVTIRNGDIDYMISNAFSNIIELDITVQYTKTSD